MRLSATSAIRSTSVDLFTVYGTLVMKMVLALLVTGPFLPGRAQPDRSRSGLVDLLQLVGELRICPPVGKSGPLT